ncbi:hypothetical protein PI126_g21936 [Phytophthora idaei]|nr:hypothetical protein PI126_g21936 [Phytophthora idaei]
MVFGNQRFRKLGNLAFVLQQEEDLDLDGGYDTPPAKTRDFRADNIHAGRLKPKRPGRAFVGLSEGEAEAEQEWSVRFEDKVQEVHRAASEQTCGEPSLPPRVKMSEDAIRQAVYRAMENSGWKPYQASGARPGWHSPRPGWQSPRRDNVSRDDICTKCQRSEHRENDCWKDVACSRCDRTDHPDYACKVQPFSYCSKFHGSARADFKVLESVKTLARNGILQGLPSHVLKKLLNGGEDSGKQLNELLLDPLAPDRTVLQLEPGQRYGWCEEHDQDGKHAVGMVHGVVNENRDRILLGTGSTMSLDLARSLKRSFGVLKIPVKVSGLGRTPTYITSEARVMVTLGGWMAMVYVLDVWLTNIGEG